MPQGKWHIGPRGREVNGTYGIEVVAELNRTIDPAVPKDAGLIDDAIRLLEHSQSQSPTRPFFLQVWHRMTHHPIVPPQGLVDRYADTEIDRAVLSPTLIGKLDTCAAVLDDPADGLRQYIAELYGFDHVVGRLLGALDTLGLTDSTITILTSDHGAASVRAAADALD